MFGSRTFKNLICNYLHGRQLYVEIIDTTSQMNSTVKVMLQGSITELLLFNIFICDTIANIINFSNIIMHVHHTTLNSTLFSDVKM